MDEIEHPGGFDELTVAQLNAYLATYLERHAIGGLVTKQGNLRSFLRHLAAEYGSDDLWADPRRHRYQRPEHHPDVLDGEVIQALLRATSGRSFHDRRDYAMIRILLTGARREEVACLSVEDLELVSAIKSALVVGLKGHAGRRVPLGDRDVLALKRWLTVRSRHHRLNERETGPPWIAEKTGDRLTGNGLYLMHRRRAVEAGLERGAIHPHLFRHTFAHEFLASGGSETDLAALAGWRDRTMVQRYGASMAQQRALEAVTRTRFSDRY